MITLDLILSDIVEKQIEGVLITDVVSSLLTSFLILVGDLNDRFDFVRVTIVKDDF